MKSQQQAARPPSPHFPPHNAPRVWFIATGAAPVAVSLARRLLDHGDYVVAGELPAGLDRADDNGGRLELDALLHEAQSSERKRAWADRLRIVSLDAREVSQCQAAVAEAVHAFGRIDVLLGATTEALVGTVEELAQSPHTTSLVHDTFEINFFANVNLIKAVLPGMRQRRNGHLVMLTGITGHIGTPGLSMYCASQWAVEGYCDSLAYEVAPFNVKVSIVQPTIEVNVLTNRLTSVPPLALPEHVPGANPAPLARGLFAGLLGRLEHVADADEAAPDDAAAESRSSAAELLNAPRVTSMYPRLPAAVQAALIAETVHALAAIGGHDNPPARHIVGFEGVTSVKEKLKTVSEELDDFLEVSYAVDLARDDGTAADTSEF